MPNPWDPGSAKQLTKVGFQALATTSSGFAGTLGRRDYGISRDEALAHAATLCSATDLPVSADLENGFGDEPEVVAETVGLAADAGLAGCSIEDFSGNPDTSIYELERATERVAAAAAVARAADTRVVLTARAENYLHGRRDLDDTIARLRAFVAAGADVVYAPGLTDLAEIAQVVKAVDAPVNVLVLPGGPDVAALASAGVARISVGGWFYRVASVAVEAAAREFLEQGSIEFLQRITGRPNPKKS